jgi:hypothetical protein
MKTVFRAGLVVASLALAFSAQARDVAVEANIGTTGLGLHLVSPITAQVNGRIGINAFDYNYTANTSNVAYDLRLKLQTIDLLADWYPVGNGFHVTGGLVINGNKMDASAKPTSTGTYTFNGTTYSTADAGMVKSKIDFKKAAPYIGIGFGNAMTNANGGWGIVSDVGVMFQGTANTSLTSSGCTVSVATCARLSSDLAAENTNLQDKLSNLRAYPVARIGVSYRF